MLGVSERLFYALCFREVSGSGLGLPHRFFPLACVFALSFFFRYWVVGRGRQGNWTNIQQKRKASLAGNALSGIPSFSGQRIGIVVGARLGSGSNQVL